MIEGIHHVVVVVRDLEAGIEQYEKLTGIEATVPEERPGMGFRIALFDPGSTYLELVSPTSDTGSVARRLATAGEGIHHIALAVDDLPATLADLRARGVRLVGDPGPGQPVTGQVFIHPSSACGVLTMLVQR